MKPDDDQARLTIDSDEPTETDRLDRHQQIVALTEIIEEAPTPLVIALYGSWGTGKTSMMKQIRRRLDPTWDDESSDPTGRRVRTIWFDPWMYQNDTNQALGLLHATTEELGISDRPSVSEALRKIALAMAEDVQVPLVGVKLGKLMRIREELSHDDFRRRSEAAQLKSHFDRVLTEATATASGRLVYFIDDLDRCQPDAALAMLEALKLYLDFKDCVYVLGVDRKPLEAVVSQRYSDLGLRTESYLDKIIQLPFVIPSIDEKGMEALVTESIPDGWAEPEGVAACRKLVSAAAANVPRDVKRLSNALLLGGRLAKARLGDDYRPEILAMLILFQSQAPSLYEQLRLDPQLIHDLFRSRHPEDADDDQPTGPWQEYVSPQPRLERALEDIELDDGFDLVPYLTLTASTSTITTVTPDGRSFDDPEAPTLLITGGRAEAQERNRIREAATSRGWRTTRWEDDALTSTLSPQEKIRRALEQADAVAVIVGASIGSWTRDEVSLARRHGIPILLFVKRDVGSREPETEEFLAQLTDPETGVTGYYFSSLDDLAAAAEKSLVKLVTSALGTERRRAAAPDPGTELFEVARTDPVSAGRRVPPSDPGSAARTAATTAPPTPRQGERRRLPPNRNPLVGRESEIQQLLSFLEGADAPLVALVGPAGVGKESILREVAHHPELPTFPSGSAVSPYIDDGDTMEDVEQAIWEEFFETEGSVDPRVRRRQLSDLEASIFLARWPSDVDDLIRLVDRLPRSVFVVAVEEAPTRAANIPVSGLDTDAALELFAQRYHDAVPDEARAAVAAACEAVDGIPGRIEELARMAARAVAGADEADRGVALAAWLHEWLGASEQERPGRLRHVMSAVFPPTPRDLLARLDEASTVADAEASGPIEPA